jgi:hypothetical protein
MAICGAPDFADAYPGAQVEIEAKLAAGYFAGERHAATSPVPSGETSTSDGE